MKWSADIQANMNRSQHVVIKKWNTTTISSAVLQLGENVGTYVDCHNQQQSNLRNQHWSTTLQNTAILHTELCGWTPPSQISPITTQKRLVYVNYPFRYITKGVESEQPVGAPFYQWVGCRDHAGHACFPHSGRWQAQGGPVYMYRDERKRFS